MVRFTPTQRRIYQVLSDGLLHNKQELYNCLDDDLAGGSALSYHLAEMRTALREASSGLWICSERISRNVYGYRLVRLLAYKE